MITPLTEIEFMREHGQANGGRGEEYFYFYRGDCVAVRQGYGEPWLGRGEWSGLAQVEQPGQRGIRVVGHGYQQSIGKSLGVKCGNRDFSRIPKANVFVTLIGLLNKVLVCVA